MSECTLLRDRTESEDWHEGRFSQAEIEHASACSGCAHELKAYRAYSDLIDGARDALALEGGMSPESWARLRSTAEKHERRAILEWMLQPALAVAMAAAVLWIVSGTATSPPSFDPRVSEQQPSPSTRSTLPEPGLAAEPLRTLGPGSVVAARSQTRELMAFDRHVLELSPRTRVTVVAWNPRRIVLNVTSGSVRAVVRRERDGDLFELRTVHARARALGTDYRVSVRQQGVTTVRVAHGAVEITDTASVVTRVQAGEAVRIGAVRPLAQPSNLNLKAQTESPAGDGASKPENSNDRPTRVRARAVQDPSPGGDRVEPSGSTSHGLKVIEIDIAPQSAEPPGG